MEVMVIMQKIFNLSYSTEYIDRRLIDFFIPEGNANGACILFIHGGGWYAGKKDAWHTNAEYFCSKGYFCASVEYRLVPDYVYPAQIEDVRLAMKFVREKADEYGFSANKIVAVGSSSGGHLAAMLGVIGEESDIGMTCELHHQNTRPNAVICYCPITKVRLWENCNSNIYSLMTRFIGSTPEEAPFLYKEASPYEHVCGKEPPFLFIHGDKDDTIPDWHSSDMHKKLLEYGCQSKLEILTGVNHGFGYGITTEAQIKSIKLVEEFLDSYLK